MIFKKLELAGSTYFSIFGLTTKSTKHKKPHYLGCTKKSKLYSLTVLNARLSYGHAVTGAFIREWLSTSQR